MPFTAEELAKEIRNIANSHNEKMDSFNNVQPENKIPALKSISATDLRQKEIDPINWLIEGILAEGLTIIGSRPKQGKSWLALLMGYCVSTGKDFLGQYPTKRGKVLYCGLEDSEAGIQERLRLMDIASDDLQIIDATQLRRLDKGGRLQLEDWIESNRDATLIILDTWQKCSPEATGRGNAYQQESNTLTAIHNLALSKRIGILLIHHTTKQDSENPFDTLSGSTAFSGIPDTLMVLKQTGMIYTLHIASRLTRSKDLLLIFDWGNFHWRLDNPINNGDDLDF